jgi:hypothetical protein
MFPRRTPMEDTTVEAATVETPATETVIVEETKSPEWDGPFDPERAARLVANLRSDLEKAKAELVSAKSTVEEKVEAEKSELQRLSERAESAERELTETRSALTRLSVAKEFHLPEEMVGFLTGSEEEMKAKAEQLSRFVKRPADDVPGKPKATLTPGHGGDETPVFDPAKVAASVRGF